MKQNKNILQYEYYENVFSVLLKSRIGAQYGMDIDILMCNKLFFSNPLNCEQTIPTN